MKNAFQKIFHFLSLVWRYVRKYVCKRSPYEKMYGHHYRKVKSIKEVTECDSESNCLLESPRAEAVEPRAGETETTGFDECSDAESDRTAKG